MRRFLLFLTQRRHAARWVCRHCGTTYNFPTTVCPVDGYQVVPVDI